MKQKLSILLLISIILSTFVFYGCTPSSVDPETDLQIREYFASKLPITPDELSYWNLGTYRGNVAFYVPGLGGAQAITEIKIAGVEFVYSDANQILIWSDGEMYTMPEAFKKHLISYFDLYIIRDIYEDLSEEEYAKRQAKELDRYIRTKYVEWMDSSLSIDEVEYWNLGNYDGNYAVYFLSESADFVVTTIDVAGVKFTYPDSRQIWIVSKGQFYDMNSAYRRGLIDLDDVQLIYDRFNLKSNFD